MNRIVLDYANPELQVLNIHSNGASSYLDRDMLEHIHTEMLNRWKTCVNVSLVASIPEIQ